MMTSVGLTGDHRHDERGRWCERGRLGTGNRVASLNVNTGLLHDSQKAESRDFICEFKSHGYGRSFTARASRSQILIEELEVDLHPIEVFTAHVSCIGSNPSEK